MSVDFEIMFFESEKNAYERYKGCIRRFIADTFVIQEQFVDLKEKKEDLLYRGQLPSGVYRLTGKLDSQNVSITSELICQRLLVLITGYCLKKELENGLISFSSTVFNDFGLLKTRLDSRSNQQIQSIGFGTLVKLNQFIPHVQIGDKEAQNLSKRDLVYSKITIQFEHYTKRLLLDIHDDYHNQFTVDYSQIKYIVVSKVGAFWTVYLILSTPALLYEVKKEASQRPHLVPFATNADEEQEEEFEENRVRFSNSVKRLRKMTLDKSVDPAIFTKSNVIQLNPKYGRNTNNYWKRIWAMVSNVNRYSNTPVYIGKVESYCRSLGNVFLPMPQKLPFSVQYAYQSFDNSSFQLHDELYFAKTKGQFLRKVQKLCTRNEKATEEALFDLFWIKDNNIPVDSVLAIEKLFTERVKIASLSGKDEDLAEVRRCILTPSRLILLPPLSYQKSRLLRAANPDHMLRVYLKDDNLDQLNFTVMFPGTLEHSRIFLNQCLLSRIKNGITLFGKKFEYLGSSTSQLRDAGMVLYAEEDIGRNANTVREEIGDLSHIKSPAKYIARIGQAFSQPIAYLEDIDCSCVTVMPDITGGYNRLTSKPYTFSDGIGMISHELAVKLTRRLKEDRVEPYSAYQIRHAGAKGMVTLNPALPGVQMILRESMIKFESSSTSIEILKVNQPRFLYLNRPFVNILEQLGVDSSVFMTIAREELQKIVDSFSCKCKALEVIKNFSHLQLDYEGLRNCDIDVLGEEFFRNTLEVAVRNGIEVVKSHARIRLPEEFGRTMFGVLDDTKSLKEGQVFVQYSMFENYKERKVVKGEVLVTKFPCMHPGDVRKFEAVDVPELHHIVDCIVFPQQGSRPHPDQMAGSDLDGDEYAVIWEKSFIFPGPNKNAMDYPSGTNSVRVNQVQVEDMLNFIIEFIQKNNVGVICNSHLALSDQLPNGIFDERCLLLAEQHPLALDYAKNGELSNLNSPRPTFYPDFMEKSEYKPTYKSKRVLGKLYRLCCLFEESGEFENIIGEKLNGNEQLLTYPGWTLFEKSSRNAYYKYKSKMLEIQRKFGVEDELCLLSGVCNKIQKYVCSRNEKSDATDMINLMVNKVIEEFRNIFRGPMGDRNDEKAKKWKMAKASAWYLVTRKLNENNPHPYYGLPWIVSETLCEVANFNSNVKLHSCLLDTCLSAKDFTESANSKRSLKLIDSTLRIWLRNSLKSFNDFAEIDGDLESKYCNVIRPIVSNLQKEQRLDIAVQEVLLNLARKLKSGNEFENMLALTASMTLRRFRRTKKFESLTECLNTKDFEKETSVTCLSLQNHTLGQYLQSNKELFFQKIKEYGVEDICCDVNGPSLFVSAFGTRECLKKVKNLLTTYVTRPVPRAPPARAKAKGKPQVGYVCCLMRADAEMYKAPVVHGTQQGAVQMFAEKKFDVKDILSSIYGDSYAFSDSDN